jgi:hypothetical protein
MEPLASDLSLAELKSLQEKDPKNKTIQKRLLIKACAVGVGIVLLIMFLEVCLLLLSSACKIN